MQIKIPGLLLTTYNGLHWFPGTVSSSASSTSWSTRHQRRVERNGGNTKGHVTLTGDATNELHDWPEPPNGQPHPTPYQIFALERNAPYAKSRFYELVKLYHPDRSPSPTTGSKSLVFTQNPTPHAVRLERYRLIVAAHTILSDPVKRAAYDRVGAGWNGNAELGHPETWAQPSPFHPARPFTYSSADRGDPIWRNATWEDWERFHARSSRTKTSVGQEVQSPRYLQNTYFLSLIVLLALGSTANYNRAQDAGTSFVEQRDLVHDRANKELRRVRQMVGQRVKDERIQWFIRQREATLGLVGSDLETVRQETVDHLLPDREICSSEEIGSKEV